MSEWQPIETAPKDGTFILCAGTRWGAYIGGPAVEIGRFSGGSWWGEGGTEIADTIPTLWMPFPTPSISETSR